METSKYIAKGIGADIGDILSDRIYRAIHYTDITVKKRVHYF